MDAATADSAISMAAANMALRLGWLGRTAWGPFRKEAEEKSGEFRLSVLLVVMEMLKDGPMVMLPTGLVLSTEMMSKSWLGGRSGKRTGFNSNEGTIRPFSSEDDVFCMAESSFWEEEGFVPDADEESKEED